MAEAIKSITSRILDLPPSCIAFVPTHPRLFVVGTYYLHPREEQETLPSESKVDPENDAGQSSNDADDEEERDEDDEVQRKDPQPQKRSGSLILFDLDPETSQV